MWVWDWVRLVFRQLLNRCQEKGQFEIKALSASERAMPRSEMSRGVFEGKKKKPTNKPTFLSLVSGREQSWYFPIALALSPTGVSGSAEIKLLSHFLPHNYLVGFLTFKTFFFQRLVLHLFSLASLAPQGWESRCH